MVKNHKLGFGVGVGGIVATAVLFTILGIKLSKKGSDGSPNEGKNPVKIKKTEILKQDKNVINKDSESNSYPDVKQNNNKTNKTYDIDMINIKQPEQKIKKQVNEDILKLMIIKINSCIDKQKEAAKSKAKEANSSDSDSDSDSEGEVVPIYDSVNGISYQEFAKTVPKMIINGFLENKFENIEFENGSIVNKNKIENYKQTLNDLLQSFANIFDGKIELQGVKFSYKGGAKFTFRASGDVLTLSFCNGFDDEKKDNARCNLLGISYQNTFLINLSSRKKGIKCARFRINLDHIEEFG